MFCANGRKSSAPIRLQAFPGQGQMKPEQEIERLRGEVTKLKAAHATEKVADAINCVAQD